jgi:hypothetical protein
MLTIFWVSVLRAKVLPHNPCTAPEGAECAGTTLSILQWTYYTYLQRVRDFLPGLAFKRRIFETAVSRVGRRVFK